VFFRNGYITESSPDFIWNGTHGDLIYYLLLEEIGTIYYLNETLSTYRIHGTSITSTAYQGIKHNELHIKQCFDLKDYFKDRYQVEINHRIEDYQLSNVQHYIRDKNRRSARKLHWKTLSNSPSSLIRNFKIKEWDSIFFGFKIGHTEPIELDKEQLISFQKEQIERGIKLIYIFPEKVIEPTILDGFRYYYSTKITLEKLNLQEKYVEVNSRYMVIEDFNSVLPLCYEAGKDSRYNIDPNFTTEQFKELYRAWCTNSLNKQFADQTIGQFDEDNSLIGFVTIKIIDNCANVGLIAVDQKEQGKGVGQNLLQLAENYAIQNGCSSIRVPTQETNVQALKFYRKNGYKDIKVESIYHLWLS